MYPFQRLAFGAALALSLAAHCAAQNNPAAQERPPESAVDAAPVETATVAPAEPWGVPLQAAPAAPLRVGDATRTLLDMQREGNYASTTRRPIAGDVATLSYQRYLDSFKLPIPASFTATTSDTGKQ